MESLQYLFESALATQALMLPAIVLCFVFFGWMIRAQLGNNHPWLWIGVITLVGLALRLGWILWTQPEPVSDFWVHWHYSNQFYEGDWTFAHPSKHPGIVSLFTYFFYLFGASLSTVWGVNLLFSAMLMLGVYVLAYEIGSRWSALLALTFMALLPQAITYTALVATEVPTLVFMLVFVWGVFHSARFQGTSRQQVLYWIALGVLLYGTLMIRSSNLLFIGIIPMVFLWLRRSQWRLWLTRYAVMALTTGILLSSWIYHQYLIGGQFKLYYGSELWLICAVQYDQGGRFKSPTEMDFYPKIAPWYESTNPRDKIHAYKLIGEEAKRIILQDPGKYLANGFVRLKNILWTSQTGIRWTEKGSPTLQAIFHKTVTRMATVSNVIWQVLLIASPFGLLIGAFIVYRRGTQWQREFFAMLGLFSIFWLGFHYLVAVASERYAFQLIPFVVILGSYGIWQILAFAVNLVATKRQSASLTNG